MILENPHLATLGTILDPGKVIFGHFIDFGHFPIEIPIDDSDCSDPLERAREKRRERLAQGESQRNRDLLQSVRVEGSASRRELETEGACLVCKKVVAEWSLDIGVALCKHCTWRKL